MKKNVKRIYTFWILLIILTVIEISLVHAQIYQQNKNIDLKIQCIINGTYCSASGVCNATISYPNGSLLINNKLMTNQLSFYNYTLNDSSILGDYKCSVTCCDQGFCGTGSSCDYTITTSGYQASLTQGVVIFFVFGVVIILAILFFIIGMKTEFVGLKLFFLSMTVILMVFLIGYIVNITNITLGEFPSLTSGFSPLYILFIALLTVGAVGLIIYLIAYSFNAFYKSRGFRD